MIALVDGSNLMHKLYHAMRDRTSKRLESDPLPVMRSQIEALIDALKIVRIALDAPGPNWRSELCPEYKSGRSTKAPDLLEWLDRGTEVLRTTYGAILSPGAEADDVLATWTASLSIEDRCVIVSADKDLYQCLIPDRVTILRSFRTYRRELRSCEWMSSGSFVEKFAIVPPQWPEYRALVGDDSDSMSGVRGVGPDAATTLLQKYATLEDAVEGIRRLDVTGIKKAQEAAIVASWDRGELPRWLSVHKLRKRVALPGALEEVRS